VGPGVQWGSWWNEALCYGTPHHWSCLECQREYPLAIELETIIDHHLQGIPASEYKSSRSQLVSGPPPPPPPPQAGSTPSSAAPAGGVAAVFADLNCGADVTKVLRKVDKSEMTHKNPALRAGSVVPASAGAGESSLFCTPHIYFSSLCG
jgi:hypothetical protein